MEKHRPLNRSVPFQTHSLSDASDNVELPCSVAERNPEDLMIQREEFSEFFAALTNSLSDFETQILGLYLEGLPYRQIAAKIHKSPKSVDNAVQRIRFIAARQAKAKTVL